MSLSYDRSGAKKNFCEAGATNFMPKSRRKTSAYEIRTFQCGMGKAVPASTEHRHWQQNMYLDYPCGTRSACCYLFLSFVLLVERNKVVILKYCSLK